MKFASAATLVALSSTALAQTCPSTSVAALVADLQQTGSDCDATASALNSFEVSSGVSGALTIQALEGNIETDLQKCLTDGAQITDTDTCNGGDVASAITAVVPHITGVLTALINQAANVATLGVTYLVTGDLTNLQQDTAQLEALAYSKLPCANVPAAQSAFSTINAAFSTALSVYSVALPTPWPTAPAGC